MSERGMFPAETTAGGVDVMATIWNAEQVANTLVLAGQLRSAGLRVEVYPDADKLGRQMKYASALGARFVTIEGDDERARGEVTVKNLATGEQQAVARAEVATGIGARAVRRS
jgi:histidyl-tRNA synthetase